MLYVKFVSLFLIFVISPFVIAQSDTQIDLSKITANQILSNNTSLIVADEFSPAAILTRMKKQTQFQLAPSLSSNHIWRYYALNAKSLPLASNSFWLSKSNEYMGSLDIFLFDSEEQLIYSDALGMGSNTVYYKNPEDRQASQLRFSEKANYYLLIHQYSSQMQFVQLKLHTQESYSNFLTTNLFIQTLIGSTLTVLFLISCVLFVGYPDKAFFWFLLFHFTLIFYFSILYGIGHYFLPDNVVKYSAEHLMSLNFLMLFLLTQFSRKFLTIFGSNKWHLGPVSVTSVQIMMLVSAVVSCFVSDFVAIFLLAALMYPLTIFIIAKAIHYYKAGFKPAYLLGTSLVIQLFGATIGVMYYTALTSGSMIPKYSFFITSVIELLIIAYAIAVRAKYLEHERKIINMTDSLTGVANSTYLDHSLKSQWKEFLNKEGAVEIVGLKLRGIVEVAHSLGPGEADYFVSATIQNLNVLLANCNENLALPDSLHSICSQSSDRYIFFMRPGNSDLQQIKVAVGLIKESLKLSDAPPSLTFVIGHYICNDVSESLNETLRKLILAEAEAKKSQSGLALYKESMDDKFKLASMIKKELYDAINSGQLQCWIQPQFCLSPFKIRGGEILIRWDHPEKGMIPPDQFIPLLEELNMIGKVTKLVLEQACVWLTKYNEHQVSISVNVSARDLVVPGFVNMVQQLTRTYPVGPNRICLEVTETAVMTDPEYCVSVLKALKRLGYAIAVDDFGTGYSSLSYLNQIQPNEIKLDQSFISSLDKTTLQYDIVRTIIHLGKTMQAVCVAEGVETIETFELLRDLSCDIGQGYLWAKPMPLTSFNDWLHQTDASRMEKKLSID